MTIELSPQELEVRALAKAEHLKIRATWKSYLESKNEDTHKAWHHLTYLLLLNKKPENIIKAFPPLTNPRKIESYATSQGKSPRYALENACSQVDSSIRNALYYATKKTEPAEKTGIKLYPNSTVFVLDEKSLNVLLERLKEVKKLL